MSRCTAAGIALLLPAMAAMPVRVVASLPRDASVKLWIDTSADNPCEQSTPASGGWLIRNNEGRNVRVVLHRTVTKGGATTEDQTQDTLGPRETRELGCEVSDDGRQTLSLVTVRE